MALTQIRAPSGPANSKDGGGFRLRVAQRKGRTRTRQGDTEVACGLEDLVVRPFGIIHLGAEYQPFGGPILDILWVIQI